MRTASIVAAVLVAGLAHAQSPLDAGVPNAPPPAPAVKPPSPWSQFKTPAAGPAQSIGGYSAGCIAGAVALALRGEGFRIAKPERHRIFGHPLLVATIQDLGRRLKTLHLPPLFVGDLAQARGGPAPTGHASHQSGLDVDIQFVAGGNKMVDSVKQVPLKIFTDKVARVVELAASDPRVERIFVNPILKRALCQRNEEDRAWLRKVRPWWGHDDHFHMRLGCPPDSPGCAPQPPLPPGDGCDGLTWWFDTKAQADRAKAHDSYSSKVGAAPPLPEGCKALLDPQPDEPPRP
jgi:penicillin-insensitive murein endopeptidase